MGEGTSEPIVLNLLETELVLIILQYLELKNGKRETTNYYFATTKLSILEEYMES